MGWPTIAFTEYEPSWFCTFPARNIYFNFISNDKSNQWITQLCSRVAGRMRLFLLGLLVDNEWARHLFGPHSTIKITTKIKNILFNSLSCQLKICPGGSDSKESACNAGDLGFDLWVGKISREKKVATQSSILALRIPWTEEPGRLQSTGLQRVGYDWSNLACMRKY